MPRATLQFGSLIAATLALFFASAIQAADPHLVKDINLTIWPQDGLNIFDNSYPGAATAVTVGSTTFLWGRGMIPVIETPPYNGELWRTDGTEGGTYRLGTFTINWSGEIVTPLNGRFWCAGYSVPNGWETWTTDGTAAGTRVNNEFRLGTPIANLGSVVYFVGSATDTGIELWRTDGTAAGTSLVKDINAGVASSYPSAIGVIGTTALFRANDGTAVNLYATDGTPEGTRILSSDHVPSSRGVSLGATVMFSATTATGSQLWTTDGTAAGTIKIFEAIAGVTISEQWVVGNTAWFLANNGSASELWRTDGTAGGTVRAAVLTPGVFRLTRVGSEFFFFVNPGPGAAYQLWKTDGTAAGTLLVKDGFSWQPTTIAFGNDLYFGGADGLWRSDGTAAGTVMLNSVRANLIWGGIRSDGFVFRGCDDLHGCEPWISDGTAAGTHLLKNIEPELTADADPQGLANLNGKLIFRALPQYNAPSDLWTSDGTEEGTTLIAGSGLIPSTKSPSVLSDGLYFYVQTEASGACELWRSDGTPAGTFRLLRSTVPAGMPSTPEMIGSLTAFRGGVFFRAFDPAHGFEPWFSDGTVNGTAMIADLVAGSGNSIADDSRSVSGGALYFTLPISPSENELWKTDGTAAGTARVSFRSRAVAYTTQQLLTGVGGTLFFASVSYPGFEVWRTDGTTAGSAMLKAFTGIGYPDAMFGGGGKLFFFVPDTWAPGKTRQLWTSGGTEAGTLLVNAGVPPVGAANVHEGILYWLTPLDRSSYPYSYSLWRSDGTAAGTSVVFTFKTSYFPATNRITWSNGLLYFIGYDYSHGAEPWVSDGTTAGTHLLADVDPGSGSSEEWGPELGTFVQVGGNLFFPANDISHGRELWVLPLTFVHGDANGDGEVSVGDLFYLVNHLFAGGTAPLGSGDANGDGQLNAADVFYLLNYFFRGGPAPAG